jgi:hypothetical protein
MSRVKDCVGVYFRGVMQIQSVCVSCQLSSGHVGVFALLGEVTARLVGRSGLDL